MTPSEQLVADLTKSTIELTIPLWVIIGIITLLVVITLAHNVMTK